MDKCLFSLDQAESVSLFRASEFKTVAEFRNVISDFDKMYESYQNSSALFTVIGSEEIVLIAETSGLNIKIEGIYDNSEFYDDINVKIEEVKTYLIRNQISELTIDILYTMIINEDFNLNILVEKIAQSGQSIKIQYTNIAFGNSEFEINT
jgi:hypothetical protein